MPSCAIAELRNNLASGASHWDGENIVRALKGRHRAVPDCDPGRIVFHKLRSFAAVCRPCRGSRLCCAFSQWLAPLAKLCRPCRGFAESRAMRNRNGRQTDSAGALRMNTPGLLNSTKKSTPAAFEQPGCCAFDAALLLRCVLLLLPGRDDCQTRRRLHIHARALTLRRAIPA
jgi:hypothetical protein